jgi:endonuclease I
VIESHRRHHNKYEHYSQQNRPQQWREYPTQQQRHGGRPVRDGRGASVESPEAQHQQQVQQARAMVAAPASGELRTVKGRVYYDPAQDQANRDRYYGSIISDAMAGKFTPAALYSKLNELSNSKHTTHLGYDPAENLYPWVDLHPDGQLKSIYSGKAFDPETVIARDRAKLTEHQQRQWPEFALRTPLSAEGLAARVALQSGEFNCEHVVPQSWFHRNPTMRGDLHHLFACEPELNSERGSLPYMPMPAGADPKGEGRLNESKSAYWPGGGGMGPAARAFLYFLVTYPGQIGDEMREMHADSLPMLLQWNRENPPTEWEKHRNAEIEKMQGNRNPFIDFPELADKVDFTMGFGRP